MFLHFYIILSDVRSADKRQTFKSATLTLNTSDKWCAGSQQKDTQINIWWNFEAERQRHHGEVQGVDAVDLFERMGVVSPHVGLVGLLGRLVEVVVLLNQLLHLRNKRQFEVRYCFSFL